MDFIHFVVYEIIRIRNGNVNGYQTANYRRCRNCDYQPYPGISIPVFILKEQRFFHASNPQTGRGTDFPLRYGYSDHLRPAVQIQSAGRRLRFRVALSPTSER